MGARARSSRKIICRVSGCLIALLGLPVAQVMAQHNLTGELPKPAGATGREIVLVAGATGKTGRLVIEQLRRDGRFAVRGLARNPAKARATVPGPYEWVAGDVTRPQTLGAVLAGARYVICAIGATERSGPNSPEFVDYGGVKNLIEAGRDTGVRQFVLESSMGVQSGGGVIGWILNLMSGDALKWKAKAEAVLRASGIPYTIVRPGGLSDDAGGRTGVSLRQGDQGFGEIPRADVAAVMIEALGRPEATGKTFEIASDEKRTAGAWRKEFAGLKPDVR